MKNDNRLIRTSKVECKRYIYKILNFLENSDYSLIFKTNLKSEEKHFFRYAKTKDEIYNLWGLNNENDSVIYINLDSGVEIVPTIIHEVLHSVNRELSEEQTEEVATDIMKSFTPKLFVRFLQAVCNKTVSSSQFKNMERNYVN